MNRELGFDDMMCDLELVEVKRTGDMVWSAFTRCPKRGFFHAVGETPEEAVRNLHETFLTGKERDDG